MGLGLATLGWSSAARAGDGPVSALGNMLRDSPTLTIVTGSVLILGDVGLTTLDAVNASHGQDTDRGVYYLQSGFAAPQAIGFAMAPFFFDINGWRPTENLLLLLPFQALSAGLLTHGIWSAVSTIAPPAPRLGVSMLVGVNWAFTATAIGCLSREAWSPIEVGIAGMGAGAIGSSVAIERAIHDENHRTEWGVLAGWSIGVFGYGVASTLGRLDNQGPRKYGAVQSSWSPYIEPALGGATGGITGIVE